MRASIAGRRSRVRGIAERPVESRRELRGVGQDADRFGKALLIERIADDANASVEHVGWRDEVGARSGMSDGCACKRRQRGIVEDLAVRTDEPTVAMARVLAEADVGGDHEPWRSRANRTHRRRRRTIRIPGRRSLSILLVGQAEEQHAADTERCGLSRQLGCEVGRDAIDARQGTNWLATTLAGQHKQRQDQLRWRQHGLAQHGAEARRAAITAWSALREHARRVGEVVPPRRLLSPAAQPNRSEAWPLATRPCRPELSP